MALYARLDKTAVEGRARRFGIGDITAFSVMDGGRENTSYCVETNSGKYVLTLVATSFWRFRHYHMRRPEPQMYDKHVEMQNLANAISEYPDSRFTELFADSN